jgi:hypothetical protein
MGNREHIVPRQCRRLEQSLCDAVLWAPQGHCHRSQAQLGGSISFMPTHTMANQTNWYSNLSLIARKGGSRTRILLLLSIRSTVTREENFPYLRPLRNWWDTRVSAVPLVINIHGGPEACPRSILDCSTTITDANCTAPESGSCTNPKVLIPNLIIRRSTH